MKYQLEAWHDIRGANLGALLTFARLSIAYILAESSVDATGCYSAVTDNTPSRFVKK